MSTRLSHISSGNNAPANLIKQIKINSDQMVDVILIVRGGGSLQDLMAFNDESFVREISKSSIPTIGIGHEPDITLADYASDLSKETLLLLQWQLFQILRSLDQAYFN